jgi:hypothetical protein
MTAFSGQAILGTMAFMGLFFGCASAADEVSATPDPGAWHKHEYNFRYIGFTSAYSCDGLADQLKRVLIAAGARSDVKSSPGACAKGFGRPDKFASASLTFYTLEPAASAQTGDSARIDGIWRAVNIAPKSPWELALGDCELVEQFRDHLLPLFTTRNVDARITCVPHQLSGSGFSVTFESFVAVPDKSAGAQKAP